MTDPDPLSWNGAVPAERIDQICDEFERTLLKGADAHAEEYLDRVPAEHRAALLRELLLVELWHRRERGAPPLIFEYLDRFPGDAPVVRACFAKAREAECGAAISAEDEQERSCTETRWAAVDDSKSDGSSEPGDDLPETFGRYRIVGRLGRGAMGAVFLAEDTILERRVALKIPRFNSDGRTQLLARFYTEARAAALLRHPNICPVYDFGEIDGQHYLAMAWLQGQPLRDYIDPNKIRPQRKAALIVRKLAGALQEAHRCSVVHRDLKPANVMIDQRGEPIVMDFGLARQIDRDATRLTQHGAIVGSPAYMSPEQVEGSVDSIGPPTDIYSLGVMFYELLTGQLPFQGGLPTVLAKIVRENAVPPSRLRADLDPRLEAICLRMMSRLPQDRFPSMADVEAALAEYLRMTPVAEESAIAALPSPEGSPRRSTAVEPVGGMRSTIALTPPSQAQLPRRRALLAAALVIPLAVLLGVLPGGAPKDAVVRIHVRHPGLTGELAGQTFQFAGRKAESLKVAPGDHSLTVVAAGRRVALPITLFPGNDNLPLHVDAIDGEIVVWQGNILSSPVAARGFDGPVEARPPTLPRDKPELMNAAGNESPEKAVDSGPALRAEIPAVGGEARWSGMLWHPGLPDEIGIEFTLAMRCVEKVIVDEKRHRRIEIEVQTPEFEERASLLVDLDAWDRTKEFLVREGYVLAGPPSEPRSIAVDFDPAVDQVLQQYGWRDEKIPTHRLSVHDVLVLLFDAKMKTSQELYRVLHSLLLAERWKSNQHRSLTRQTVDGVEALVMKTEPNRGDGPSLLEYEIALSEKAPFSWVRAEINFGQKNRLFRAVLQRKASGDAAIAALPAIMPVIEASSNVFHRGLAAMTLPQEGGAWARYSGTLLFNPKMEKDKLVKFDLKGIELRLLGSEEVDGVPHRWLEVEVETGDSIEIGRLLVNEESYRRRHRFEIARGVVRDGATPPHYVRFDPTRDAVEDAATQLKHALPKGRLGLNDALYLLFDARIATGAMNFGTVRSNISRAIVEGQSKRTVTNAGYTIQSGRRLDCQVFSPRKGLRIQMGENHPPTDLTYEIRNSEEAPFGWVTVSLDLSLDVQGAQFPLMSAKLEMVDSGDGARSSLPGDAEVEKLVADVEKKLPKERTARGVLKLAQSMERARGASAAEGLYRKVVNEYSGTEAAREAEGWLKRYSSRGNP